MTKDNKHTVNLIDDGTMDTVISVNGKQYRYNMDENWSDYQDFFNWACDDAIEQYEMDCEEGK